MSPTVLRYPDGRTGAALVLLRLGAAAAAFPATIIVFSHASTSWPALACAVPAALALVAGLTTRTVSLLLACALVAGLALAPGDEVFLRFGAAASAVALALLGPGAFSLDARRFGRRVIRVEPRPPERGGRA